MDQDGCRKAKRKNSLANEFVSELYCGCRITRTELVKEVTIRRKFSDKDENTAKLR
jgi:hypothetical protein